MINAEQLHELRTVLYATRKDIADPLPELLQFVTATGDTNMSAVRVALYVIQIERTLHMFDRVLIEIERASTLPECT